MNIVKRQSPEVAEKLGDYTWALLMRGGEEEEGGLRITKLQLDVVTSNKTIEVAQRDGEITTEVSTNCTNYRFPGRGQRLTPVTCAKGVIWASSGLLTRSAAPPVSAPT